MTTLSFAKLVRSSIVFSAVVLAALSGGCVAETASAAPEPVASTSEAWDSQDGNPTHATHSYLTEYAVSQLGASCPELTTYKDRIVYGANRELHELPLTDAFLEALRKEVVGTNWAAEHPELLWKHAQQSFAAGDKQNAYLYLGILLHYVEDMAVPAHAFHVIHQGTISQMDDMEFLALQVWAPTFNINKSNPNYTNPADYVLFSGGWARDDFSRAFPAKSYALNFFPISWLWTPRVDADFIHAREGRAATAATWALSTAAHGLGICR